MDSGPHGLHVAQTVDRVFHRHRDERLDLFGRKSRRLGLHIHLRLHKIWKNVQLGMGRDIDAIADGQAGQRDNRRRETAAKNGRSSSAWAA